ncbi:hypothetical protein F2Q69_00001267 [Brassica cretica]|uniref:Uncharacterized protein n=1 Tax=Brassica cretica TaxID=69181 RepID=A0A8S9NVR1_BRACR|nr:hypothetical protein F2Q69_00001267 [Brassica cretica]
MVSRLSHLQSLPIRGRVKTPCVASWILDRIFGAVYGTRERPSCSIDLRSSYSRSKEKGLDVRVGKRTKGLIRIECDVVRKLDELE